MIGRLFRIEAAVRKRRQRDAAFGDAAHLALRQRRSRRQVERIVAHTRRREHDILPRSGLGSSGGPAGRREPADGGALRLVAHKGCRQMSPPPSLAGRHHAAPGTDPGG
jgi:hypothetical protein